MGVLVIFIGGVCGVGKTQVGKECSKQLVHACFLDGTNMFHRNRCGGSK